jgi:hypothetical protein
VSIMDFMRSSGMSVPNWFQVLRPMGGVRARPLLRGGLTGREVQAEQELSADVGELDDAAANDDDAAAWRRCCFLTPCCPWTLLALVVSTKRANNTTRRSFWRYIGSYLLVGRKCS